MITFDTRSDLYNLKRKADHRIINRIMELLDIPTGSIIADIGAGTGNYTVELKNQGYNMIAIEPSIEMSSKCTNKSINWINCFAENIALPSESVDAVIAMLSIHHFNNIEKALQEMHRILRKKRVLITTFNPQTAIDRMWVFDYCPLLKKYIEEYFCEIELLKGRIEKEFDSKVYATSYPLPYDLTDAFSAASWRYPERFVNPEFQKAMSLFHYTDEGQYIDGIKKLKEDILNGEWNRKYNNLLECYEYDVGYTFLNINN